MILPTQHFLGCCWNASACLVSFDLSTGSLYHHPGPWPGKSWWFTCSHLQLRPLSWGLGVNTQLYNGWANQRQMLFIACFVHKLYTFTRGWKWSLTCCLGLLCATRTDLKSCGRDHVTLRPQYSLYLQKKLGLFDKKSSPYPPPPALLRYNWYIHCVSWTYTLGCLLYLYITKWWPL